MKIDQKRKQNFLENPFTHDGKTLLELDCNQKMKKKAFVLQGNFDFMINNYFQSRCDYILMPQSQKNSLDYDVRWTDYHYQQFHDKLIEGKQIINHIKNLKDLISFKDKFVLTLRELDKKKLYNFDSNDFHFKTFLMNLDSKAYNDEEQEFMNKVDKGFWMTKDPDGSLGLGIQIFKDLNVLKQNIKDLKSSNKPKNYEDKRTRILQYSVIQEYMANPLLIDNKKVDLRGYVLIASLDPFVVLYQDGFIRSCIQDYDTNFQVFDQLEALKHLTNRIYQKRHRDYQRKKEDLMLNPLQFEEILRKEHNFGDKELAAMMKEKQKIVAYSIMAAKDKFYKQKGVFQLMGVDIMWDEYFNAKLIEFNTSAGLYNELKGHKYVIPQLVQSTLDLILETLSDQSKVREKWAQPEKLELGRWQIIINEASGYNVLDQYLLNQNNGPQNKNTVNTDKKHIDDL
ncbi:hypothetical protein PPERSA_01780 [Pseudocohnilembus persalinus]|uniref:Tubulin-tyrosine ligase/Tubulin polyglutamylase n=1 Tax=Pseudocohnilembus persalinus TaxID=266149 RepID=A0A0V0R1A9_PSEPJ|nr:hypothetical protein PPERSA_01780 [Pseudocohnilembus persalinus]|eukprot:KRX08319.1 hypothetical protein PPERSA_01780 [Pseudocohnilembus persalinus]